MENKLASRSLENIPGFGSIYGTKATKLGFAALAAAEALADKPGWRGTTRRRWLPSDRLAFRITIDCVSAAKEVQIDPIYDRNEQHSLIGSFGNLHRSLPFTEGERHELVSAMRFFAGNSYPEISICHRPLFYVEDAGRQRLTSGRDLMDARWAWRRSVFEFEGQDHVYATAQNAACRIAEILVPQAVEASVSPQSPSSY
jgi:hypothetical protein